MNKYSNFFSAHQKINYQTWPLDEIADQVCLKLMTQKAIHVQVGQFVILESQCNISYQHIQRQSLKNY